jgi:two-component system LytT family sensor kinase
VSDRAPALTQECHDVTERVRPSSSPWILYAVAWVPVAALYALALIAQRQATPYQAIVSSIVAMGTAAAEGAGVWWLTGRVRMPARGAWRFWVIHLGLALAYASLWLGVLYTFLWLVAGSGIAGFVMRQAAVWQGFTGVWIYALVAGVSYLIRTQRDLREQQIAAARLEAETARLEAEAIRVQLQAVRAQINPHFFYNALHSLSALIRHDRACAEAAVERLGQLMRYALDRPADELVTLADEWAFASGYLELERLRLGERLRSAVMLDDDALECMVPPFVLQPLVENAVRHAIAPRVEGGTVTMRAWVEGEQLWIEVADDGPGAPPGAFDGEPWAAPAPGGRSAGHGLRALRRMLDARYGGQALLEVESQAGPGFRVRISIPASVGKAPRDADESGRAGRGRSA